MPTVTLKNVTVAGGAAQVVIPAGIVESIAVIQNLGASTDLVYFTADGSAPSASNGLVLAGGQGFHFPRRALPQQAVQAYSPTTPLISVMYA